MFPGSPVLEDSAADLATAVANLMQRMNYEHNLRVPRADVILEGRVFDIAPDYAKLVVERIRGTGHPHFDVRPAAYRPVVGALLLARMRKARRLATNPAWLHPILLS